MIFNIVHVLLFLSTALTLHVQASNDGAASQFAPNEDYNRPLRAARRIQELTTRTMKGCLSHNHLLHYVDGENTLATISRTRLTNL